MITYGRKMEAVAMEAIEIDALTALGHRQPVSARRGLNPPPCPTATVAGTVPPAPPSHLGGAQQNRKQHLAHLSAAGYRAARQDDSLRATLEEAIDAHEDDPAPDNKGDLSPLERTMVRNLLHFGERDAGDVGVPRADIVAVEERTSFADLVKIFAERDTQPPAGLSWQARYDHRDDPPARRVQDHRDR